jgi:hypothetical protein
LQIRGEACVVAVWVALTDEDVDVVEDRHAGRVTRGGGAGTRLKWRMSREGERGLLERRALPSGCAAG